MSSHGGGQSGHRGEREPVWPPASQPNSRPGSRPGSQPEWPPAHADEPQWPQDEWQQQGNWPSPSTPAQQARAHGPSGEWPVHEPESQLPERNSYRGPQWPTDEPPDSPPPPRKSLAPLPDPPVAAPERAPEPARRSRKSESRGMSRGGRKSETDSRKNAEPRRGDSNPSRRQPRRKRVVLADPRAPVTALRTSVELEEQTTYGAMLINDLMGVQLKLGLTVAGVVVALIGGMPALFLFVPSITQTRLAGVPLPWLLLGVLPFALLVGAGFVYNRRAERNERDFVDSVEN